MPPVIGQCKFLYHFEKVRYYRLDLHSGADDRSRGDGGHADGRTSWYGT